MEGTLTHQRYERREIKQAVSFEAFGNSAPLTFSLQLALLLDISTVEFQCPIKVTKRPKTF